MAMAFVALGAPAQNGGDGQSVGRTRGRDHAQEKQDWFLSGRSPWGESAAELLRRAFRQKLEMRAQLEAQSAAHDAPTDTSRFLSLQWMSLGPAQLDSDPTLFQSYGLVSGRVTAIAVDQKDLTGNTVYIGSANGGVWKSVNAATADPNAVTWQPLTDEQPSLAIGALAIQPGANSNVILAGTGEANQSTASYYGMGILRSTDGGASWSLVSAADSGTRPFRGLGFSRIAFHTGNPDVVVAATTGSNGGTNGADIQGEAGRGLYFSLNAGQSWNYAAIFDAGVAIQASSVTDVSFDAVHNKFYAVIRGHGYYESAGGQVWSRMAQQPGAALSTANCPTATDAGTCPLVRAQLSVRADTGEVFTAWIDATNALSIYKLPSNGAAWQKLGQAGIDACGDAGPDAGCGAQQGNSNLTLKAVPNGSSTDLYFGAVNLFKCSAGVLDPLCTSGAAWVNLTHAYGCNPLGAPAHVHPGQHAIDFSAGSPNRIYFGNDGGVYRTMSGFTLNSGTCETPNAFDNLNAKLGPLGQFTGLAQPATDVAVLLGGVQSLGSPIFQAGDAGTSGALWRAINLGDGGVSAIDPTNGSVLYTSFPAGESITIQRCTAGVNCRQNTWSNVADSAAFAHDGSAYFAPYILDPRNPATLLAGTCRVWRGPAAVGAFTAISGIFSGGGAVNCAGGTTTGETKIRSLAAGGATAASGNAKVIYAGMVGRSGGASGRIFVTTDSDAGPAAWNDRTSGVNPSEYDVADIALSPFDATGSTAYAAIMGFGVAHIFKTANAGVDWANKNGNLPDVPVNSLALDPANSNLLYAGTDIGVYVSADDGVTWAELGSGLPNVPVVKLLTFVSGGTRKLRAATIGRGVWQIDLPVAAVKAVPAAVTLNATVVGRSSPPQTIMLTNDSTAPLNFTSISASGPFGMTHDCPTSLLVGAACNLSVTFVPNSGGVQSGTLTVNYAGGSMTIPLSAVGVDFALTLSRPARTPRNGSSAMVMDQDGVATFQVSLTSEASTDDEATFTCQSPTSAIRCSVRPKIARLNPGTIVQVVVQSSPLGVRRSKRLSPSIRTTYILKVRAAVGAATKVVEVPVQIR